jgi:hypothetical protein
VTTIEDRLYFFSGSADLPPGQGVHERVADTAGYDAFQAAEMALVDSVLAERFALESDTELAHGDGATARKHRKLVLLTTRSCASGMGARTR